MKKSIHRFLFAVLTLSVCTFPLFAQVDTQLGSQLGTRGVEKSLLELEPVQVGGESKWQVQRDVVINGRLFEGAATMQVSRTGTETVVFSNRDDYDLFEASVGKPIDRPDIQKRERGGTFQFVVAGDGQELFRSRKMREDDPAQQISISIKGYSAVSLSAVFDWERRTNPGTAAWANPVFLKLPPPMPVLTIPAPPILAPTILAPPIPVLASPAMDARIRRSTPLVWESVERATGYLLELQAVALSSPVDANRANRFVSLMLPADITIYNFDVGTMPKGRWRWRVHSLSDTDILGEMTEWRTFSSQG